MKRIRILLAEDDVSTGALLWDFLEQDEGLEVCGQAYNGWEALMLTLREKPDLLLTDLVMPGLDGLGLLRELRELSLEKRPKVIVLSGVSEDAYIRRAIGLGASYYLVKPVCFSEVSARIKTLFSAEEPRRRAVGAGLLTEMGADEKSLGYRYACFMLSRMDELGEDCAMKILYLDTARAFRTSYACVERDLRTMIRRVHARGERSYARVVGAEEQGRPPGNGIFLRALLRRVQTSEEGG